MLFFIGVIVVPICIGVLAAMAAEYDKMANAVGWGFVGLLASLLLFGLIVPAISTEQTELWDISESPISDVETEVVGSQGYFEISYRDEDGSKVTLNTNDNYFSVARQDIDTPILRNKCDLTPVWAAPYDIGNCSAEFVLPNNYVLNVN